MQNRNRSIQIEDKLKSYEKGMEEGVNEEFRVNVSTMLYINR